MNLSNEDNLRMNVLLHQDLHAIRIDESKMIVYGLSDKGEAKVTLKANCKDEVYIKRVKELISTHVLGSPGGYPIFLRRWTRMGQSRTNESLERLLQLGESEAIVAVVNADHVTDEIARRAWWAMPSADNARCLLRHKDVVNGEMGKILADFLVEFLPFEEEPRAMIESTRLVLQENLISNEVRDSLWKKGQRKNTLLIGFLKAIPDAIPLDVPAHSSLPEIQDKLNSFSNNIYANIIKRIYSKKGQAYLHTLEMVIKKPSNQDVVVFLFETTREYFEKVRPNQGEYQDINTLLTDADTYMDVTATQPDELKDILKTLPELRPVIRAILILSMTGEPLVRPVFTTSDAIGSVMRRKLEHIFAPVYSEIAILRGNAK